MKLKRNTGIIEIVETNSYSDSFLSVIPSLIMLAISILSIVATWKIFVKAGKPGWAAIVPIYNIVTLLHIINKPGWWILLFLVPVVNIIISLIIAIELAKVFGKGTLFGVLAVWLFNTVGMVILGFGNAKYVGVSGATSKPQNLP